MDKVILLDWGGPVSNNRTWKMPKAVDPVAIKLLNDLCVAGWQIALVADLRTQFEDLEAASAFMSDCGLFPRWYKHWRMENVNVGTRHLAVRDWLKAIDPSPNTVFMVVDDDNYPTDFLRANRMTQIYASSSAGIDYLSISEAYRFAEMTDAALDEYFEVEEA